MLEELLKHIREGGSFDPAFLAKKLNTTPEMVSAMLDHLRRMGLMRAYQPGKTNCSQCSLAGMCHPEKKSTEAGHLWVYEAK